MENCLGNKFFNTKYFYTQCNSGGYIKVYNNPISHTNRKLMRCRNINPLQSIIYF